MPSTDKHIISFQVDSELKAALHRLAEADGRSLSSYIKRLLQAHTEAHNAEVTQKRSVKPRRSEQKPASR